MSETASITDQAVQAYMFRKSLPMQVRLQEIRRVLGPLDGKTCLELGSSNGIFSAQLRRHGGTWHTVALDDQQNTAIRAVLEDRVHVAVGGNTLPFKKKLFDVVVIDDFLERFEDDIRCIEECHKVLRPDGRLIVTVSRRSRVGPVRWLRNALGLSALRRGLIRDGYTEAELFAALKTGFDVTLMRAYSRFFVELVRTFVDRATRDVDGSAPADARRVTRAYGAVGFFFWLAYQLDFLMLFSRGYRLLAVAKRRGWRPRDAPVLVDGRSITEAVLSSPD